MLLSFYICFVSGKYLYFNSRAGRSNNAIIRTPWLKRQQKFFIEFSYHMYGSTMGGLRVYAFEKKKSIKHGERKFLWEKLDNQKNKWHVAKIIYTPHDEVQVYVYIIIYISLLAKILQPVSLLRLLRYFCKKTKNVPKTNRECSITYGCSGGVIRNSMVASRDYTKE